MEYGIILLIWITYVNVKWGHFYVWNQSLVNLDFDNNKIWFETNDYISSVIMQENLQSDVYKEKIKLKGNQ